MPLTVQQIELMSFIDQKVRDILENGGDEILVMTELLDKMPEIKRILIDSITKEELNKYCGLYEGFYQYMKILENVARGIASGDIKVPTFH